ncbi:MAG TPA: hypothetical protein VFC31_16330 [Candidatus Limnocylindria bacterium]|nr:hypothetical protein [Candidatus Limnocylindria bacterium]
MIVAGESPVGLVDARGVAPSLKSRAWQRALPGSAGPGQTGAPWRPAVSDRAIAALGNETSNAKAAAYANARMGPLPQVLRRSMTLNAS